MTVITGRRDFFKIAAGGAALLAMPSILVRPAMADMAQAPTGIPFSRFKLGDFTVTIINDGSTIMEKPQATFGTDQTKEAVSALLEANHLPADRLANGFAPTLVQTGSDTVLAQIAAETLGVLSEARGRAVARAAVQHLVAPAARALFSRRGESARGVLRTDTSARASAALRRCRSSTPLASPCCCSAASSLSWSGEVATISLPQRR